MTPAPSRPGDWWVNQGGSFDRERAGGLLWAPAADRRGRTYRHWTALLAIRAGDRIVHYRRGAIVAVSRAIADGERAPKPPNLIDPSATDDGYLVRCAYRDLDLSIPIGPYREPLRALAIPGGPIAANGAVKQGYLWRFSPAGRAILGAPPA